MATSIPALQAAWTMLCRSQVTAPGMAEAIQAEVIKDQGTAPAWTNHPFTLFFFYLPKPRVTQWSLLISVRPLKSLEDTHQPAR